jgi:outer membrane lipoprotein-sorting protein
MDKENIEEILKNIGAEEIPAEVNKIAQETSNNFSSSLRQTKQSKRHILLEQIMKSPITKFAAAAIVAIACLIGLSLWRGTESGIALADVLARMEQVKAIRYQFSSKIYRLDPNKPYRSETHGIMLVSQEYGVKTEYERPDPNGGQSTFKEIWQLPDKKTVISILHEQKKYLRIELGDDDAERNWERMSDPNALTRQILKGKYESMGRSVVDGVEVEGFRTTDSNYWHPSLREIDAKIWVDVKRSLPVRYDVTGIHFDNVGQQMVYHNFQWDVPVDPAEFKPVIPEGYTTVVIKYPAHNTEGTAIEGLKLCVEFLGNYPESLWGPPISLEGVHLAFERSETPAALQLKEKIRGLTAEEITNKLADSLVPPIWGLYRFYVLLYQDKKDPAYYGKIVTPKDADKVLMRWKLSDNEYRVIYGDLHAETVNPEKLAELEAALSK